MQDTPRKQLSLFDSTCLIVGIIVGTGIFEVSSMVASSMSIWWAFLAIWLVGGLLSLCGALGYAELATAYPREGGDYVYLGRAYGRGAGFLFGWTQLAVVRPGDIAVMAFIFGKYAQQLYDPCPNVMVPYDRLPIGAFTEASVPLSRVMYAGGATLVLTLINVVGVQAGKWAQNALTIVKIAGLLAIVAAAFFALGGSAQGTAVGPSTASMPENVPFALILVLFCFGGWNEMAYVAAEVKNPKRNIIRALVVGTVSVTVLYLAVNAAYLLTLGFSGVASSKAVAAETIQAVFPGRGAPLFCALVCISSLGAANGLIFTGARISYAMGAEHRLFRLLGEWHGRTGTPARALLLQGAIALVLILVLGGLVEALLYTAAAVYGFYLATSVAVIVLRFKEPDVERPYRVTGYPFTTLLFCAVCGFLIYSAATYQPRIAQTALGIVLLGVPIYWLDKWLSKP